MLNLLKTFARRPDDTEEVAFRKVLILIIASSCSLCGIAWSSLYCYAFGPGFTASLPFAFTIIVGSAIVGSHLTKTYKGLVLVQLTCITWITALIQWSIGSIDQSGMVIAWAFLGPLGALIFLSLRQAMVWMMMFLTIVVITAVFEPTLLGFEQTVAEDIRTMFYIMNIGTASTVVFGASAWFVRTIQSEKDRSEDLLLNILPAEVAQELKSSGKVEPKDFENTTVLFTDFKGFTEMSDKLPAKELVAEIHHCFKAFDEITARYGVEKIKTIGDAYMAVGGGMNVSDCPPCSVVMAGLEMNEFMVQRRTELEKEGRRFFEMRVGIHSGHVVAGVVGVKKFQYDVWGDTVNIASRMESNGEAGKVNISETTYELVKDKFKFTERGEVDVKGKGGMKMYFVDNCI